MLACRSRSRRGKDPKQQAAQNVCRRECLILNYNGFVCLLL